MGSQLKKLRRACAPSSTFRPVTVTLPGKLGTSTYTFSVDAGLNSPPVEPRGITLTIGGVDYAGLDSGRSFEPVIVVDDVPDRHQRLLAHALRANALATRRLIGG